MVLGDLLAVLASTDATRRLILHQPSAANHRLVGSSYLNSLSKVNGGCMAYNVVVNCWPA